VRPAPAALAACVIRESHSGTSCYGSLDTEFIGLHSGYEIACDAAAAEFAPHWFILTVAA